MIPRFNPEREAPEHLGVLVEELETMIAPHQGQRFFWFSVPPRHWKTVTLVNAIVKHLHRWPGAGVGYFSHTQDFATDQSKEVRKLARQSGLAIARGSDRQDRWQLTTGAKFYAHGIQHVPAGIGVRLAVIDDPIETREDANSKATRDKVFNAIEDDLRPRLTPDGCVILVHTRWNPDDPIGRYKKRKNWRGQNIPALSGPEVDIPLLPKYWSKIYLEDLRQENPYKFESLYQGNPILPGAQLFKDPMRFDWVDGKPVKGYRVAYGVDLAYSARTASDFSVCVRLVKVVTTDIDPVSKKPISIYYVTEVQRKHVDAPSFALTLKAMQTSEPGPMLWYAATSELGAGQFITERVRGFRTRIAKVDKLQRAQRVSEAWNRGRVLVPGGDKRPEWVEPFVDELTNFTGVKDAHDDQVDALAAAFDLLADEPSTYQPPPTFGGGLDDTDIGL